MRLAYVDTLNGPTVALGGTEGWRDSGTADPLDVIRQISNGTATVGALFEAGDPIEPTRFLPPIPRPGKLLFCGINYPGHLDENPTASLPETPFFFSKLPTAIIGPDEPIAIPSPQSQVDWEVELAVVIGRTARGIPSNQALDHVFGYTVVNDVSARDVQFTDMQITLGKGFDTFCPMGPEIVLADELSDPSDVTVSCFVNGERMQHAHTGTWLFTVPQLIEAASRFITLEPGDIVTTGTPAGVGFFRNPPRFLAPGDLVVVEADRIGRLSNPVTSAW